LENKAYSKLNIFRMVEYEAVLYVDLDIVIIRQFSRIFQIELPAMITKGYVVVIGRNTHPNGSDFNAGVILVRQTHTEFDCSSVWFRVSRQCRMTWKQLSNL
jgi:hypothetical protein